MDWSEMIRILDIAYSSVLIILSALTIIQLFDWRKMIDTERHTLLCAAALLSWYTYTQTHYLIGLYQ